MSIGITVRVSKRETIMKVSVNRIAYALRAVWLVRQDFPVAKRPKVYEGKKAELAIEHFNSLTPAQRGAFLAAAFCLADFVADVADDCGEVNINITGE